MRDFYLKKKGRKRVEKSLLLREKGSRRGLGAKKVRKALVSAQDHEVNESTKLSGTGRTGQQE